MAPQRPQCGRPEAQVGSSDEPCTRSTSSSGRRGCGRRARDRRRDEGPGSTAEGTNFTKKQAFPGRSSFHQVVDVKNLPSWNEVTFWAGTHEVHFGHTSQDTGKACASPSVGRYNIDTEGVSARVLLLSCKATLGNDLKTNRDAAYRLGDFCRYCTAPPRRASHSVPLPIGLCGAMLADAPYALYCRRISGRNPTTAAARAGGGSPLLGHRSRRQWRRLGFPLLGY